MDNQQKRTHILRGNIVYTDSPRNLVTKDRAFLVCADGICRGVFDTLQDAQNALSEARNTLPEQTGNTSMQPVADVPVEDFGDKLIIPGLVDLHLHAPQYAYRGLGMDMDLVDWLNNVTFPEEAKYAEITYAARAYDQFVSELQQTATTRMCVFGTIHPESTLLLARKLSEAGFGAYVGKVNMDRNSPESLCEESATASFTATMDYLRKFAFLRAQGKITDRVHPILTPRFIPSCSRELMEELGELARQQDLKVQSHLSESKREIEWVAELEPEVAFYGDCYARAGMMGNPITSVMAHCIWSSPEEIQMMKDGGVFIAHCPQSNTNLASGIAPIRHYLEEELRLGLGTDIAGGFSRSVFRAIADAIQVSKLYFRHVDETKQPLTLSEAFYMGTMGGGAFFGKVGSFLDGYDFDAVVIDDSGLASVCSMNTAERIERTVYMPELCSIVAKYVAGERITWNS
ncbi:MAG: amidohydrolase family protein [Lachnospiraceae bacterium]|nr:amidohydrolase family protein [Lachnospiraceae bacterium]